MVTCCSYIKVYIYCSEGKSGKVESRELKTQSFSFPSISLETKSMSVNMLLQSRRRISSINQDITLQLVNLSSKRRYPYLL